MRCISGAITTSTGPDNGTNGSESDAGQAWLTVPDLFVERRGNGLEMGLYVPLL
jgi:hypothetical protein